MKRTVFAMVLLVIAFSTFAANVIEKGDLVKVTVKSESGKIEIARKKGYTFFSAPIGSEYTISVRNTSSRRILVIPTVDGLNVIDRSKGNWDGSGYVLEPYRTVDIPGFRRQDDFQYVERFTFNKSRFSLANRIGDVQNVGVIGVAVFEEYVPPPKPAMKYSRSMDAKCGSAPQAECEERAGTEAGRTVHDPVRRVNFRRATDNPAEILALYYDTEENLISAGILPPHYTPPPVGFRSPFPSNYANYIK